MDKTKKEKKKISPIRAVFFDIGNVLLEYDVGKALKRFSWAVKSHPVRVARLLWSRKILHKIECGTMSGRELYAICRSELEYPGSYTQFKKLFCGPFRLNRKTAGILKRCASRVPTYLLSNTNFLHYEFIRDNYTFPTYVKGAVLSYKLKLRKPDRAIYDAALKIAKVKAAEAFFVDDLSQNVVAARRAGWQSVRYRSAEKLERELRRLGVL
jgi:putative hydrolase of the HAD superfamily